MEENVDKRRSAFFRTVLARDSSLLNPFFSLGTEGPSCAVELIVAAVVEVRGRGFVWAGHRGGVFTCSV